MPMTNSEMIEVSTARRSESCPSPLHTASSIWAFSSCRKWRTRYQATAPMTPATTNDTTRRKPVACSTPVWKLPPWYPKAK